MGNKHISDREKALVCKRYIAGWTLKKISAYSKLSQTTILRIIKNNSIPLRNGKQISTTQANKVIELYNNGESILNIIEKTDVKSEQTIYRILCDAGVKRRRNTNK